ncbi:hypothetical protein MLD38_008938 [Melastoma candidum]|uniref:Uncharacterized protein n=1 Tax=Melastoma candidum TaxID=119954 RepID=A0ACB9RX86_9MYRT|nr:hypothetical protein MLD38_008938 [Melastoma candidum]
MEGTSGFEDEPLLPRNICLCNKLIKLLLFSNGFEDELPNSLVNCTSLFRLRIQDFSRNNFSGDIPDDLGDSSVLQFLNISGNSFERVLPSNIWGAPNLLEFSSSSSRLIGPIPDFIACKSLYKIELGGNSLNGSIPRDIGHCEKLENLNLSRNSLTGIIPWEISTLPSITELDLSQNFLSGSIPSNFDNCTTLDSFNVSFNSLTGPIPSSGSVFRNLHPSSFLGNVGLCGGVIEKPCGDITASENPEIMDPQPRNIVRLLGCCSNRECTMLLYLYMPNGNLDYLLHGKNKDLNLVADWLTRYKIALGVAQAKQHLLDAEMEARVADFGVTKLIQCDKSMSIIAGSYGYIAPEYAYTLQVVEKSDIYSYGVVLMEMLCGKRLVDQECVEGNSIVAGLGLKLRPRMGSTRCLTGTRVHLVHPEERDDRATQDSFAMHGQQPGGSAFIEGCGDDVAGSRS